MEVRSDRAHAETIVELVQADDAQIDSLLETLTDKMYAPQAVRDRLAAQLCECLSIQRVAEEEVLFPALRAMDDKLVFGFLLVGLGISMRVSEVRDTTRPRALREASLAGLVDIVGRNLDERKKILLPFAKTHLSETQLAWLGDDYQQRKGRLWTVVQSHGPRPVGVQKPTVARNPVSLALWRKGRSKEDAHPH